jgi:uncharacterized protein YmfQ (DUF2313 family)
MVQFKKETLIALGFCGAVAVTTPLLSHAQMTDTSQWNQGQAELQKQLKPGMTHDSYRRKIEEMGYKITSTNYNNPDYLEYEVVKGDQTWEVQIDIDDNTRNATKIDISQNVWKTDATTAALEQAQNASRTAAGADTVAGSTIKNQRTTELRNNQYSDRDRTTTDELVRELDALPVGHDKEYYKNTLRQRGYEITKINKDDSDELELEAVKGGHSVQLEIEFDEDNMRSTEVDASTLWAESESTTRARETQEPTLGSRTSSDDRTSLNHDNDRRLNDRSSEQD